MIFFSFFGGQSQAHAQIYLNVKQDIHRSSDQPAVTFYIFFGNQTEALADFGLQIDGKFSQQV